MLFIGLQNYCRFGVWSKEENMQLKKNWKNATKVVHFNTYLIIDRVAEEIIYLVASVCPSVCLWALSCFNRLTFDLNFLA